MSVVLVECQTKSSSKKTVRFAAVLCEEMKSESYLDKPNGMLFYPAPPQHDKPTGTVLAAVSSLFLTSCYDWIF